MFQKVKLFQAEIYQISYLNEKLIYVLNSPYFLFAKKKKILKMPLSKVSKLYTSLNKQT